MIVYRYLSESELFSILKQNVNNIGKVFYQSKFKNSNTHKYQPNVKYLHFFKKKESLIKIKKVYSNIKTKFYICKFDIPMVVLMLGRGYGYYNESGYDIDLSKHREYIVPVSKFKTKWLKDYMLDDYTSSLILL